MLAYTFTSAPVAAALIAAQARCGRRVVVDHRNNIIEDRSGKARAALGAMSVAGIHDRSTTQMGSFNFSSAAANANSENVILL